VALVASDPTGTSPTYEPFRLTEPAHEPFRRPRPGPARRRRVAAACSRVASGRSRVQRPPADARSRGRRVDRAGVPQPVGLVRVVAGPARYLADDPAQPDHGLDRSVRLRQEHALALL